MFCSRREKGTPYSIYIYTPTGRRGKLRNGSEVAYLALLFISVLNIRLQKCGIFFTQQKK
jgi:hypothetical protein